MADVKMDWNDSAFAEIAKSAEVQAELEKCAQRVAKVANYDAQKYSNELYEKRFKVTPFAAGSKILNNTAIGYVYPNSEIGRWMQAAHKCLSKQIH